ncbi:hypothetical protein [Lysinibacillus xylanilyticus]|uniref:Uncharacterized protein n=1 Tax=Lysinibacillus xylanilyticus TaxID=582475 RepID=A0A2M9QAE4_9BACI|nr:hypothetical protein [Lysinibacillus xylanilyticus]MCY9549893.1 hypothetical protein [Lysinibacillus xylanilyticus]MED3803931.1 hypothetical protein [Lysinibacillus xylanilyticus]PJO44992.1 hypothetical protein CWD94_02910 [Lysinibacillus xylanilyticus]
MRENLEEITISFCEQNGDVIMTYDINNSLSALIPNVSDVVNIDGNYRAVSERAFTYSPRSIIVTIYLEEL